MTISFEFFCVQDQLIAVAPVYQCMIFLPVGHLMVICDQPHDHSWGSCIICKLEQSVGAVSGSSVMHEQ